MLIVRAVSTFRFLPFLIRYVIYHSNISTKYRTLSSSYHLISSHVFTIICTPACCVCALVYNAMSRCTEGSRSIFCKQFHRCSTAYMYTGVTLNTNPVYTIFGPLSCSKLTPSHMKPVFLTEQHRPGY